ncbi:DEAD/DEAH box helicase [Marivirga arenosa]|uniref:DEAD/DEAH box helicase n=1 Tax=Marivirga arenosa TaxID=3059076 RepID=A0AA51X3T4_9BACT|nr:MULTISPECIES: DEAD/DEAH box helicase [unclassified Marivirga]WMN06729.1 DEAD/DEAH box helicase [Marivirga sp. ABR2-2]WNB16943.1 DEAD/DEAH box helicase [Marivirga sp. BKB1-2]
MEFNQLNFHPTLSEGLEMMGFKKATPIQTEAIPKILEGKDLIACAQTGTGKTAAFVLPILHKIASGIETKGVNTVIIAPTRELVQQIDQQIEGFSYFTHASSIAIYGGGDGAAWEQQKKAIRAGVDILVATPGRLIALLNSNKTQLDNVQHLILDEADRMLDMGFYDDIMRIIKQLPTERQTLLFSATMPPKIKKLAGAILNNPEEITLSISKPAAGISQKAFLTYDDQKIPLSKFLLGSGLYETAIIFASKKDKVKALERELKDIGMKMKAFSSDLDQSEREVIMRDFRSKKVQVLIGTDIISRGIDVENISLVINYDVPGDPEDYVHRIGRTARAATKGEAITFINEADMEKFNRIESLIEKSVLKTNSLPNQIGQGPEYQENARKRKPGGFNKRKSFKKRNK